MKQESQKIKISGRKLLFRLGTVVLLIAVAALMLLIGRGHTVYFDNKEFEYEGKTYEPVYKATIFQGKEKAAKLSEKDRGMVICIGQTCKIKFEITKEKNGAKEERTETIRLPYSMDGILINLPAYLAGLPQEAYLSEFIIEPEEEENTEQNGDGIPEGEGIPADDGFGIGGDI